MKLFCPGSIRLLPLLACLSILPAAGQEPRTYEITVPVDVTAEDAVTARNRALAEGPVIAAQELFRRMAMREDFPLLPKVTPASIARMVRAVDVSNEQTSSVRYLADLNVIFDAHGIRDMLAESGVRFAETVSRPVLVLPVLRTGDAIVLWDEANPWLAGWANQAERGGLVPLQVPLGDIEDVNDIGGDPSILSSEGRLLQIAQRHGVKDVMVATATVGLDGDNRPSARVDIDRFGTSRQANVVRGTYPGAAGQSLEALLADVAAKSARGIEENWKRTNLIQASEKQEMFCMVPLDRPADWATVRERLRGVQLVRRYRQISLTTQQVRLYVAYVGTLDQLETGMAQHDLRIAVAGDACVIQPREANPVRVPPLSRYMPRLAPGQGALGRAGSEQPPTR